MSVENFREMVWLGCAYGLAEILLLLLLIISGLSVLWLALGGSL